MLKGQLIGNLGRDAELKEIAGVQYAVFSVAHSEKRTDRNGQPQEFTTWVRCMKRDANARLCPHLLKGKKVYVDGRLSLGTYTAQSGETRYELSIWVDSLEFMDAKGDGQNAYGGQQGGQPQPLGQQGGQTSGWRAPGYMPPEERKQQQQAQQGGWDDAPF